MARINKQVIKDYFGSFFKQYSPISKELFTKIRSLVDEAQCGCCSKVTIYWDNGTSSDASPLAQQVVFKDVDDNILASTTISENNGQVLCVPEEATQICLNVVAVTGGTVNTINLTGNYIDANVVTTTNTVNENCDAVILPLAPVYTVTAETV